MNDASSYVSGVVRVATPAFVLAATLGVLGYQNMPRAAAASAAFLVVFGVVYPRETAEGFKDSIEQLGRLAVVVATLTFLVFGLYLFREGARTGSVVMLPAGGAIAVCGFHLTKLAVKTFILEPEPEPVVPKPIPIPKPSVPIVRPPAPPPPPAKPAPLPTPEPKPKPRELVLLGGRYFPAAETDEHFFVFSGPPGQAKTKLFDILMNPMVDEILETKEGSLEPANDSRLIVFDPKREAYAKLASRWPKKTLVPLQLLLPSDVRSVAPDVNRDYRTMSQAETYAHSVFQPNPNEIQPFFPNALRTLVALAIFAIKRKLGFWTLRLLVLILSNPGYLKRLIGADQCTQFSEELLSDRSPETAQNVRMEIASKLLRLRILAAHYERAEKNKLSLEEFLAKPGVLVISRHPDYLSEHDAQNGMILTRIGQIIEGLQQDPHRKRKTYIMIDEFPTVAGDKPIPGIVDMMLRLRSLGVVFVITFQTYASLKRVYKDQADELLNTTRNFIILGSGDPTDAKHAAEMIGKIRGYEAQRNESATDGDTEGASDTTGEGRSKSKGKQESWTDTPVSLPTQPWFGTQRSHTWGTGEQDGTSTNKSHTDSRNKSHSTTEGVTWIYVERDIFSPTELMRWPLATPENGVSGVAYRAGEPRPWDFTYSGKFIDENAPQKSQFIAWYERRREDEEILPDIKPGELANLDLTDAEPRDDTLWGTAEDWARLALRQHRVQQQPQQPAGPIQQGPLEQSAEPIQETQAPEPAAPPRDYGPIDWDDDEPDDIDDDPEDDEPAAGAESCSPEDFLNDQ